MTKKRKKHKPSFKEMLDGLNKSDQPRVVEEKKERQYFLIVSEGEKTEPNYFYGLAETLHNNLAEIEVVGEGADTITIVKKAIELRDERKNHRLKPPYDEVWVVFDKDEFPAEKFNAAIDLAAKEEIGHAYSNEAFELWYILHFEFLNTPISRSQYVAKLKKLLGSYKKNQGNIYQLLQKKGNESAAIKSAKRLFDELSTGNPAAENPTTLVYLLVERLNEFKR